MTDEAIGRAVREIGAGFAGWGSPWPTGLEAGAGGDRRTPLVAPAQAAGAAPPEYRSGGVATSIVQTLTFGGAGPLDASCPMPTIGDPDQWGGPIAVPGVLVTVTVTAVTAAFVSLAVLRTMSQLGVAGTQALTAALASTAVVLPLPASVPSAIIARVVSGGAGTMTVAISCLPVIDAQVPITADGEPPSRRRDHGASTSRRQSRSR